jgi:hypothetical protein
MRTSGINWFINICTTNGSRRYCGSTSVHIWNTLQVNTTCY